MMWGPWGGSGKGKGKKTGPGSWGKYEIDESGGVLGEFTGTIKSFGKMRGYGFIECADLHAQYSRDTFIHGDLLNGCEVGQTVKFTAFLTKEGHPQAKDVKAA